MPFLGPKALKSYLNSNTVITDGNGNNIYKEGRVEEAAYALSLGSEAYRTDNKDRKIEILDNKSRTVEINPGQFTLLMTDEYLRMPKDKLAFISIKAKQKLKGLINVSGFHVDPGFEGKLVFSVYNAGPSTITLETKKPYFLIWFADLNEEASVEDAYNDKKNHHQGQKTIPMEYVDALKRGDIASPNTLLELIKAQNLLIDGEVKKMNSNLETRIRETERKYLNLDYFYKLLIGILIAIFIRYLFIEVGITYYTNILASKDTTINQINRKIEVLQNNSLTLDKVNSIITDKVDSIITKKLEKHNAKK